MFALRLIPAICALSAFLLGVPVAAAGSLSLAELTTQAQTASPGVFGTAALPSDQPYEMAKWQGIVAAARRDHAALESCLAAADACPTQDLRAWRTMAQTARDLAPQAQLRLVNRFFNKRGYRADVQNYGQDDRWAPLLDFLRLSGDCEDYAIAKFSTLLLLGIAPETLRVVAVFDTRRKVMHAVLSVRKNEGLFILDNLREDVVPDTEIHHYRPLFSLSLTQGWIHLPKSAPAQAATAPTNLQLTWLQAPIGR